MGDSKTAATAVNPWQPALDATLTLATGEDWVLTRNAIGGLTMPQALAQFTSLMAMGQPSEDWAVREVLLNFGVNDAATIPGVLTVDGQALWVSQWVQLFDLIHARFPQARVFAARPWMRDGADSDYDTLAAGIAAAVAERPAFAAVGMDERVWLKGADDGATMTTDGIHYSAAGAAEAAAQWAAVLGYP
jgi:lysophospholipase L1-like esterase